MLAPKADTTQGKTPCLIDLINQASRAYIRLVSNRFNSWWSG